MNSETETKNTSTITKLENEMFTEMFLTGFGYERISDIKPNMNFYNE